ncbi:MAG TPA: DNA gyrase inhibitor YacG [Geobacteraceae bacterium]|nr:DNA gyrase inhibitor YacG [Geobacteraceae bacterium]
MVVACPVCRKKTEWEGNPFRPFCSERCRMVDLGAWAGEEYRIPGDTVDDEEGVGDSL